MNPSANVRIINVREQQSAQAQSPLTISPCTFRYGVAVQYEAREYINTTPSTVEKVFINPPTTA
jgi:hypothetical protein